MSGHDFDEMNRTLGRIEAGVESLIERDKDQEKRLKRAESHISWFKGVLAAISTALAGAWAYITHFYPAPK